MTERPATEVLRAFQDALPPFSSPETIRRAAHDRPDVLEAALEHLERAWVDGPGDPLGTAVPLLALSASPEHLHRFGERVLFRLSNPAGYRVLVPLLIGAIDDSTLEDLLVSALESEDAQVVANALDLQYHAYGWPDRFCLSKSGARRIGDAVVRLEARADAKGPLAAALQRYQPRRPGPASG